MNPLLRSGVAALIALLLCPAIPSFAQTSTVITTNNSAATITIEFLGKVDNGNGTYTWSYRVTETSGKDLSHWILGLCMDLSKVIAYTPGASDAGIGDVEKGPDGGGTSITGIKWEVEDDFDDNGTDGGDSRIFSFTLNMDFAIGPVPVGVKSGGSGGPSQQAGTGSINGPVCTTGDLCVGVDPADLPSWDGNITEHHDGTGSATLKAPLGLQRIELFSNTNLELSDVQDTGTMASLVGPGMFECSVPGTVGCLKYTWTGDEEDAPTEVKLVLVAPGPGRSFFFVHFSDLCDHTVRIDPELYLYAVGTETLEAPESFALEPNYPNPFHGTTTIRFMLPEAATVRLAVYDLLGREVTTLFSGELPAGSHTVSWAGRDARGALLPSGVYLYRLEAGTFVQTRHMTLLK
ncbi:T9SS type A sorting domain-containing protein [Rhodocaloribacter litoris]|uniref:FlgD immunoglobulin-like domain containing protein n=1 Tax=Rhodocaloribacter litoris TaxID=2558931 RepID=UPI0014229C33|nr:FlgD immunoglobulin-like domain containing protein [Rhodocaloribacter litoris]QXD16220.1 T9SS type A sorting domain-containing protein [Rhodocaloribacter litoris]